jgi:prevent-host-death family protein
MKVMTASEASRAFSAVLDEAERGETIVITRGGRRVATIAPAGAATWGAFREALRDWSPLDDPTIEADVRAARDAVTLDEDPWRQTA